MINLIMEPVILIPIIIATITLINLYISYIRKKSPSSKGAVIGFFIGLILVVADILLFSGMISILFSFVIFIPLEQSGSKISKFFNDFFNCSGDRCMLVMATLGSLFIVELFSLLGFIVGLLWGKMKSKNINN